MNPENAHAIALNYPSGEFNSADLSAPPGSYVIAYVTGQGALNGTIATGEAALLAPLLAPLAAVTATVGGVPADIAFVGLAPGIAGLLQLNLKIPEAGAGEQIFQVSIGGVLSNSTVLSVGNPASQASTDRRP
jgi:uncharacterized protein (TIGR03437 family)